MPIAAQPQRTRTGRTAESWPISTCMVAFPGTTRDGLPMHEAGANAWNAAFREISLEGFSSVEVSDGWLKPALLDSEGLETLRSVAAANGLAIPAVHIQRASIIDPDDAVANLAYQHASIDAVAALGASVYSMGLHRPFTAEQREALWFWTVDGPRDPDDEDTFQLAVARVRELGEHAASVGLDLSLELYEDTYLGTAASAVRFVESVDLANVGLNPDVGNLIRLHRPVEDWRELYATTLPYANYWHLKNYSRDEAADGSFYTAVPSTLRDGTINYREVVKLAIEVGYDGPMTCEQYGGDSLSVCAENSRYLRGLLATALDPAINPVSAVPVEAGELV
jgi:sugar phosphate isomerase/epimerase